MSAVTSDPLPAHAAPLPARSKWRVRLHWLTVLAIVAGFVLIEWREAIELKALRAALLEGHRWLGLLVLGLCVARLLLRARSAAPQPDDKPRWMRVAAALTHAALYALLLAMPLLGWALSSADGRAVNFLGLPLPSLVAADEDLADALKQWHEYGAWTLAALVHLHVAAALWHHTMRRDGVLRSMWPPWPR